MQMKEFVDRTTEGSNEEDKISPAKKVKDGEWLKGWQCINANLICAVNLDLKIGSNVKLFMWYVCLRNKNYEQITTVAHIFIKISFTS